MQGAAGGKPRPAQSQRDHRECPRDAPQRRPLLAPGRGHTQTQAAPGLPEVPGSRSELTLSQPDGLHRVGEREVSLRGHPSLSSLGVQAPCGMWEKTAGTTYPRSFFTSGEKAPPEQS